MRSTFRILFYVNKQRAKDGRVPIYVQLTVNGKSTFISSRLTIPLALWDFAANKAAGKSAEARNVNAELNAFGPNCSTTINVSPTATPMSRPNG